MVAELSLALAGWPGPNATTKRSEITKVRFGSVRALKRRRGVIFAREGLLDTKIGMESIWPEFDIKIGAVEHGTKSVTNGLMCAFNWSILVGAVGAGGSNFVAKVFEKSSNFWVIIEFATLIQEDILVLDTR
jgi:hypothetical protein